MYSLDSFSQELKMEWGGEGAERKEEHGSVVGSHRDKVHLLPTKFFECCSIGVR